MASPEPGARRSALAQAAAPQQSLEESLGTAIEALRNDRLDDAESRLRAVLARWPGQADALHFLGVLRHAQGRHDDAIELIHAAIAAMPGAHGAWNNLGNVLVGAMRLEEAIKAYEHAAELASQKPDEAGILNNLGVIHRKQSRYAQSEAAIRRALELQPDFAEAWYNLSKVLIDQRRIREGLLANGRAVTLWPRHLMARDQVVRALLLLGERDRAAELYREWLAEDPGNPVVLHQLAACLGEQPPDRASDAYIEQVFDSFAQSFDVKLESLHYRAPTLVRDALRATHGEPSAALDMVDLGCGTGLCGPLIRPWARSLAGCDLSVGMLRRAKLRSVYDVLHKAELVYYLDTQPDSFDVAVSADTLCYFGDLNAAMHAAAGSLRTGGRLIFTVEALSDEYGAPHLLQTSGRYAHSRTHLVESVSRAGLMALSIEAATLRMEAGCPVEGWVVTAGKS